MYLQTLWIPQRPKEQIGRFPHFSLKLYIVLRFEVLATFTEKYCTEEFQAHQHGQSSNKIHIAAHN